MVPALARTAHVDLPGFPGKVVDAATGDPEGNGGRQLAVSFWRPYRRTDVNAVIPRGRLVDRRGLTAHVGLYVPGSRRELWVAGTLLSPVSRLAPCDGSLAVAYTTLNGTDDGLDRRLGVARLRVLAAARAPGPRPAGLRRRRR